MSMRKRQRQKRLPLRLLAPNMITVTAICAGLFAILYAIDDQFKWAVIMVVVAAVLDGLDGRVARFFKSTSAVGAELDSLADFLNFGVVPALVLYLWSLNTLPDPGWLVVLLYVVACALRLARFNVMSRETAQPDKKARFFTGVPAPMGAMLAFLPMFVSLSGLADAQKHPEIIAVYLACIAYLMLSRIPTFSFKKMTIQSNYSTLLLLSVAALATLLVTRTWHALILINIVYLVTIPFAVKAHAADPRHSGKVVLEIEEPTEDE